MKLFVNKKHAASGYEIDDAVMTATEEEAARFERPLRQRWLLLVWGVASLLLLGLGARVFFLTVIKGGVYADMAERNSLREIPIPAPRGIIYDRNGTELVRNLPATDLIVVPRDFPQEEADRKNLREHIKNTFSDIPDEILDEIFLESRRNDRTPLLIKKRVTQEETLSLLSNIRSFPGVTLFESAEREYVDSALFAHIIGYEGKVEKKDLADHPDYLPTDSIGKQGVERHYEAVLRGVHGAERVIVDAFGHVKERLGSRPSEAGQDLILHVDAELQKKLSDTLSDQLSRSELTRGAAIAMNPKTGGILALVSLPNFDNNIFSGSISSTDFTRLMNDPDLPLFNRAVSGEYAPGSTIKPVMAAAALAEGIITEHTSIESRGGISVGKFFFGDWKAHGYTDLRRAIAVSSDVYFYSIGGGYGGVQGLGIDRMKTYAGKFGYGSITGIDIPGEANGFYPDEAWKEKRFKERWYIGDDYHAAIGQGYITATPLQVLNSIATIANGGTLRSPRVVAQIRSREGKTTPISAPILKEHVVSPEVLRVVREGMRETVTEGTAQMLNTLPVAVAGKTGTAQFGTEEKTHGWFVSFAPYDDPEIALIVLAEGQGESGYHAVPVANEIYRWYFEKKSKEMAQ